MDEEEPLKGSEEMEPTKVPLTGPGVTSTFDTPPHPDAVKAQEASIRKHLQERRPREGHPDES